MAVVIGAIALLIIVAMAATSGRTPATSHIAPPPPAPPTTPVTPPEDKRPRPPTETAFAPELREIDEKLRAGLGNEDFRSLLEYLAAARARRSAAEWLAEIDLRSPQIEARARRTALPLREKAIDARKRKDDAEVKRLRDQIASWNLPTLVGEFDKALEEATASSTNPPPPPPPPPSIPESTEPPLVVYADTLAPGWRNHSWSCEINLAATSPVFEGAHSVAFTPHKMAAGIYFGSDGVDASQYPLVTFALYVAEDVAGAGVALYNDWKPSAAVNFSTLGGLPPPGQWKRYVLPVKDINRDSAKITGFLVQVFKTGTKPLIYLDSVSFLKGYPPAGKSPTPTTSSELDGYRTRWATAAQKAAARDYPAAQKELEDAAASLKDAGAKAEAAADLDLLKLAAQVPAGLDKWAKGAKVKLDYLNAAGDRDSVEGTVLSGDAVRVSVLQRDGGPVDVPTVELLASTIADQFRGRPEKKPTDARAAAAFCFFEGDVEAGRALWGDGAPIPEKLLGLTRAKSEAEVAARRTFWAAESEFLFPKRRSSAVEKYAALLADATPLAAKLKPFVTARLEAARDAVYLADDLSAAGSFVPSATAKMDACWVSSADSPAARAKENYVEAEFHAFPGTAYKAWIWAGACCQETFEFLIQASDLTANGKPIEPGGDAAITAKLPSLTLRKWHAQHGGPKEPAKWDWIPVALPKYEAGGPKKLRVMTAQQGFTVGAIVISASRRDTPREAEMKELEKSRFGSRKGAANSGPQGLILCEWWYNIEGDRVEHLTKHPSFAGKPGASAFLPIFEGARDAADNYGTRMRGYVHPPVTGAYTFWISSDDEGELHLSADDSPVRKRLIASNPPASAFRDWTKVPTQKSAPIVLTAGRRYYIEALQKEGGGQDHLSVGWTLPDGTDERPIPGTRLSPWSTAVPSAGPAGHVFFRGYNVNGESTVIDGRKWEGKKSTTLAFSPEAAFENFNVPLNPPTDEAKAAMLRTSAFAPGGTMVKVYQVPAGAYQVYLYCWEDNDNQVYDILLNGREVKKGHNSGTAGHWDKLGPWPVTVSDNGVIEIRTTGGDANLSGLEIWKKQ
jgi:hypothetical protein